MITELLFQQACKGAVIVAAGIGGMGVLASDVADECLLGVRVETIRELGSFGLVAVFVLGILWAIKGAAPKALDFLKDCKDGFLCELAATRKEHAAELANERASREAQVNAIREMMSAHRTAMEAQFSALKQINEDGNKAINSLVEELKERPCQKKTI
jgi:hypothetical protein